MTAHEAQVHSLADYLVCSGWTTLYGGVKTGLIAQLADAIITRGGPLMGAIAAPEIEDQHLGVEQVQVFETFSERKTFLFERSAFVCILPGGLGTFDEVFSQLLANKLGTQRRPMVLWDGGGFWQPVRDLLLRAEAFGFLSHSDTQHTLITADIATLSDWLQQELPHGGLR